MQFYALDYETKSRVDLTQRGLDNYVQSPSFGVLLAAVSTLDGLATVYEASELENYLKPLFQDSQTHFIAHNALFEYMVSCWLCKQWGIPAPALSRFHCTQVMAMAVGLPAALGKLAPYFDDAKHEEGKALINLFCVPQKDNRFATPEQFPEEWITFRQYCLQDTLLNAKLWHRLPPLQAETRSMWLAISQMNLRGFLLDLEVIDKVLHDVSMIQADANAVVETLTRGAVTKTTQGARLLKWLQEQGIQATDMRAENVLTWARDENTPDDVKRALWARLLSSKSTFGKYAAFLRYASSTDHRNRHGYRPYGAHTGRLAGMGSQPQNITYDREGKYPGWSAAKMLDAYMSDTLPETIDKTDCLVFMTRSVIKAPTGRVLYVVDYAAIEARILVWLADIGWALDAYRRNEDLYKPMAATILGKRVEDVSKAERNRYGKVTVLGCGYGLGWKRFGEQYGRDEQESKACVYGFRNRYAEVPQLWKAVEGGLKACIMYQQPTHVEVSPTSPSITFEPQTINGIPFIVMTPPGGRKIWYRRMEIDDDGQISHERDTKYGKKRYPIWAGHCVENLAQNIAGVIISRGMRNLTRLGALVTMQTHDEIIAEVSPNIDTSLLDAAMVDIDGFPGLPLAVESDLMDRYGK